MRFIALSLLALLAAGCAAPEQVYFTKPGEWDPAALQKDRAECEAMAENSAPYRRIYGNPFMSWSLRDTLVEQTRECLIHVHGWKTTETLAPPP